MPQPNKLRLLKEVNPKQVSAGSLISYTLTIENIGAIPVGENDKLIGMVTDRDIALRAFDGKRDAKTLTARDVMTKGITWCRDSDKLKDAAQLMEEKQIRRLPVIDDKKRMVGMLALGDLAHATSPGLAGETLAAVSAHHA